MATMFMLIGLPACGKSYFRADYPNKEAIHISSDDYIEQKAAEANKTYSEVFKEHMSNAIDHCHKLAAEHANSNKDIIWDQTNLTVRSRADKLLLLPNHNKVAIVFPVPDAAEWRKRLSSRPGKTIPDDVLNSMLRNFTYPTLEEGFHTILETKNSMITKLVATRNFKLR